MIQDGFCWILRSLIKGLNCLVSLNKNVAIAKCFLSYLSFYPFSDKLKESSPVVKVHIECYHNNTSSSVGSENGNPLTKYGRIIHYI